MTPKPIILVVDPAHYDVHYVINPWMHPDEWQADPVGHRARRGPVSRRCAGR